MIGEAGTSGERRRPSRAAGALIALLALVCVVSLFMIARTEPYFRPLSESGVATEPRDLQLVQLEELVEAVAALSSGYAYPEKLLPRKMFYSAVQALSETVPSMLVSREDQDGTRVRIRVMGKARTFDLSEVEDLYSMAWRLMEAAAFLVEAGAFPEPADQKEMEGTLLRGMLEVLDPHTNWLDEKEFEELRLSTNGRFGGLGILISVRSGVLTVVSVMEGTPAREADLQKGDRLVQIGNESTVNMTVSEAAGRLRGEPGTAVTIWVDRDGWEQPRKFALERRIINVRSVEARVLSGGVALVRVKNFQRGTTKEMEQFLSDHASMITAGLILDLRQNSGGVMDEAVSLADAFLADGLIVETRSRAEPEEKSFAHRGEAWEGINLLVLVDGSTASASEIVTAALKLHDRAVVLGERTFGKGSVQYLEELKRGALKMTIAQYLGPGGVSIQGSGIQPDVEAIPMYPEGGTVELSVPYSQSIGEGDLENHLLAETRENDPSPPSVTTRYFLPEGMPEGTEADPPVELARQMLVDARDRRAGGRELLELSLPVIRDFEEANQTLLREYLASTGVEWGELRGGAADVSGLSWQLLLPEAPLQPGAENSVFVRLRNRGPGDFERLHVKLFSLNRAFDGHGCVIGRLRSGEGAECEVELRPKLRSPWRTDPVAFELYDDDELLLYLGDFTISTQAAVLPRMLATLNVTDLEGAALRALVAGKKFTLLVGVQDVGAGQSPDVLLSVKALDEDRFYVSSGRDDVGLLEPGGRVETRFVLSPLAGAVAQEGTRCRFWISDGELRSSVWWDFRLPSTGQEPAAAGFPLRLVEPSIVVETSNLGEGWGEEERAAISGRVDFGGPATDMAVGLWRNDEKIAVVDVADACDGGGICRFELSADLEPGVNRLMIFATKKDQSQSYLELVYNRDR